MNNLKMIMAISKNYGIGLGGKLPWNIREDLKFFKKITTQNGRLKDTNQKNVIIMGHNTWKHTSFLEGRDNIVVTHDVKSLQEKERSFCSPSKNDRLYIANSFGEALAKAQQLKAPSIFVIGGKILFEEAKNYCEEIFLTQIGIAMHCDTFLDANFFEDFTTVEISETRSENEIPFDFRRLVRKEVVTAAAVNKGGNKNYERSTFVKRHAELQYLELLEDILSNGVHKKDRTGVGVICKFGGQMRFDLMHSFPLLTTKNVFWRGVVEELMWFIRGETDSKLLARKGVNIWNAHGSRNFLQSIGMSHRKEGDLGPIYGFQFRHFGAHYVDCETDYTNQGIDQLNNVINDLTFNRDSRRILMSAWNCKDLNKMTLPPCHVLAQFYVANSALSCHLYQRSCDMGLGLPFNIASYSLLCCLLAEICGLKRGEFIHSMGDMHIYKNHVDVLQQQIQRIPKPFPYLKIVAAAHPKRIEDYVFQDFKLIGYDSHSKLAMNICV